MFCSVLPDYNSGSSLRAFLEAEGLSIRKQWGQHFLVNPKARSVVVDALEAESGSGVWEIGSGLGCMTLELLKRGMNVTAFEIDPGFCSLLERLFGQGTAAPENQTALQPQNRSFTLVRGNVLKTWRIVTAGSIPGSVDGNTINGGAPYLLGNLPYTVAALLMGNLIEEGCLFTRMAVTVQKEVALRMAAGPGSKNYSSISVLCASAYRTKIIMTLKGSSFYPAPHVESAVIRFDRLLLPPPPALFYPLVRSLFASRRKTAANNLEHFLSASCTLKKGNQEGKVQNAKDIAAAVLERSGVTGKDRAEQLPPEAFAALAAELEQFVKVRT